MKRYRYIAAAAGLVALLVMSVPVPAGEVDILVEKLVQKGILTESDAQEILQEVKEQARKEREQVVQETTQALRKDGSIMLAELPAWIRSTTFKGDFRLRYEFKDRKSSPERHRGRYRLRLGFVTEVTDQLHVGFGLATGGTNPRSREQTMTNSFESPEIRLEYAYASYTPWSWLTLVGGKFKNPLWRPSDLLWDTDIHPEGVSAVFHYKAASALDLFMNTGAWVLDERSGDENDPVMFVIQPGYKLKLGERVYFKNALAWYSFDNVKGTTLDHSSESNSYKRWEDVLRYDYDAYGISAELGFYSPFELVPFAALFGDYVNNRTISSADDGHLIGISLGHEKVSKQYQWQVKAMYRRLERDAWLDIFPDSTAYEGETNAKGYELLFEYGLLNNVNLALDYYYMRHIRGRSLSENVLQVDMTYKF